MLRTLEVSWQVATVMKNANQIENRIRNSKDKEMARRTHAFTRHMFAAHLQVVEEEADGKIFALSYARSSRIGNYVLD